MKIDPPSPRKPSKIVHNAVGLFGLQFVTKGLSAVWTFYLARRLGAAYYGQWANILALLSIFGVLQGFGTLSLVIRDVSQSPTRSKEIFGASTLIYGVAAIVSFILAVSTGLSLGYSGEKMTLLLIAAFSYLSYAPGLASQSILYGHEEFLFYTSASSMGTILYMLLGALAVESGWGIRGIFLALSVQYVFLSFFLFAKTRQKYGPPILAGSLATGVELTRLGIPLVLSAVLVEITLRADRVIIEHFLGASTVGYYHAAFNLVYLPREVFLIPLVTAVYTRMCASYVHDRPTFERLFEKVNASLLLVALPVASLCVLFPHSIIRIFYGRAYESSSPVLAFLVWMLPPFFFSSVWQSIFMIQNRTKTYFLMNLIGAAFNLFCNVILVPRLGIVGSAVSALCTQGLLVCLIFWDLRREPLFHFGRRAWRIALA